MWASLPLDLLVEILRCLDTAASAVVRCAGVCKPWRRAIIGNASSLRLRPDRFNPNLLIGFFHRPTLYGRHVAHLHYVPGPFEDVLTAGAAVPAAAAAARGVDAASYYELLSSRDGFVLLGGGRAACDLCLCNPLTGSYSFVPAAKFDVSRPWRYVLVSTSDDGVRILAVKQGAAHCIPGSGMTYYPAAYQVFSSASGEWGASVIVDNDSFQQYFCDGAKDVVVAGDAIVYWLVESTADDYADSGRVCRCVVAVDVRTERTWTVQLPERIAAMILCIGYYMIALATSEDGRLSLILQLPGHKMDVWVLIGGDQWMLRRTIDVGHVRISVFCPRSGYLFGYIDRHDLLIDVNRGSVRPIQRFGVGLLTNYPYEMDWPTYISKMKHF